MAAAKSFPLVPIASVLFPGAVAPFPLSPRAAAAAMHVQEKRGLVVACTARDALGEALEPIGCVAEVLTQTDDTSSGEAVFVLHGQARVQVGDVAPGESFSVAQVTYVQDEREDDALAVALAKSARTVSLEIIRRMPELPAGAEPLVESVKSPGALADLLASNVDAETDEKLELLSTFDVPSRVAHVLVMLTRQLEILQMRDRALRWIRAEMAREAGGPVPLTEAEKRRYVLGLQRRYFVEALGMDATQTSATPYREPTAPVPKLAEVARSLTASATSKSEPAWRGLLSALGVARTSTAQTLEGRLAGVREDQREEVLRAQLRAIDEELER